MSEALVIILMGSRADEGHCQKIAEAARTFGLDVVMRVCSAHKTAAHTLQIISSYEGENRPRVYITVAGRSNALSGFTDGAVCAPVIACPPPSEAYGGADIYSSLRMPSGIAPAVVLDPANAALLAAKILGINNPLVQQKVLDFQARQMEKILKDDHDLQA
ncbi:MAG: AIR carboxylase family protein [Anaerolineae bacterium]|nr:AIR carboxylase family protein [Anaerolineae bacterium]